MKNTDLSRPLVSVTMPVFNGAQYLAETIQSICEQTLKDWELVAVDDCSTDESWKILQSAARSDSRIKVVRHEVNKGHRASSNLAFELARGHYVARTDQDDLSMPERLERQVDFLVRHPWVGLVGSGHYRLYPDGRRLAIRKSASPIQVRWSLLFDNVYCHSTFMFRREFVQEANFYRYAPSAYDYEVMARLAHETQIGGIPEPLVCYRIHSTGLASTDKKNMIVAAMAISSREIRRLLYPQRLTRETFCALRRLGTGIDVCTTDLRYLPDLLGLISAFQSYTNASDEETNRIWRRVYRRLVAGVPTRFSGPLVALDPVSYAGNLLLIWNQKTVRPIWKLAARAIKGVVRSSD